MLLLFQMIRFLFEIFPRRLILFFGRTLGCVFFIFCFKRNKIAEKNISIVLPNHSKHLVFSMYQHLGMHFVEFMKMQQYRYKKPSSLIEIEGRENLDEILAKNKAYIIITAHLGMWEFQLLGFSSLKLEGGVVVKPIRNSKVNQFIIQQRMQDTIKILDKKNSTPEILRLIREKKGICFLIDQNMNLDHGVYVDFGTKKACTLSAPALLALRYDLPVFASFMIRKPDYNYSLIITPEIPLIRTGNLKEEIILNTQKFTDVTKCFLEKYPDQWMWIHKRFKNQPEGTNPIY